MLTPPSAALLGALLVKSGVISERQLYQALAEQADQGLRLGEILRKRAWVTSRQVAIALAEQYGLPFVDLREAEPDAGAAGRLPPSVSRRHGVFPVGFDDGRLVVALADPSDADAVSAVRAVAADVRLAVAEEEALNELCERLESG